MMNIKKQVLALIITFGITALGSTSYAATNQSQPTGVNDKQLNSTMVAKSSDPININTADVTTLQKIDGIGPSKAKAIVEYRTQHGKFKTVHDLTEVNGISEKSFNKIQSKNPGIIVTE